MSSNLSHPSGEAEPLIMVHGFPVDDAELVSYEVAGRLGKRDVTVALPGSWMRGQSIELACPYRLSDERTGLRTIYRGQHAEKLSQTDSSGRRQHWKLKDRWGQRLNSRLRDLPSAWLLGSGERTLALRAGVGANRAPEAIAVNGLNIYPPVEKGQGKPWQVDQAIQLLLSLADLEIHWLVPASVSQARLEQDLFLNQRLEQALQQLVDDHELRMRRSEDHACVEITADQSGLHRRVTVGIERLNGRLVEGCLETPAVQGRAEASGWRVESTFELHPAWDPALTIEPDSAYSPRTSCNFETVSDVFRRWVLNEDGAFVDAPYSLPVFDLCAFFDDPQTPVAPLRFMPPLSRTTDNEPMSSLVEISEDSGSTWRVVTNRRILTERAGVWLSDHELGASYLEAARQGHARCRITASLRSPLPVVTSYTKGHAFGGNPIQRIYEATKAYSFTRLAHGSRFYDQVRAGSRTADVRDDTERMRSWLRKQVCGASASRPARIELIGKQFWFQPGDRICIDELGYEPLRCERIRWHHSRSSATGRTLLEGILEV
ncbi:hypothetical protein [Mucisphaera sp.]|uniref:hypothetical protein n=1 Tax=Mucisphaera sp. TaxID=2913024 RepID=UPI003D0E0447